MPHKRSTRLQRAIDFVIAGIHRGGFRPGEFLPGVRALSTAAGVSIETMWKAVRALREQKVLDGESGHRFRVAGTVEGAGSEPRRLPLSRLEKWRKVREYVQRDILNGVFPPDVSLPSIKELSERYGAARATLKRAFASLEDECLVMQRKGTYRVMPVARSQSPQIGITVIGKADEMYWEYWHREMYRYLDAQCSRANIGCSVLGFTGQDETITYVDQPFRQPAQLTDTGETAGFVLHITGPQTFHEETAYRLISWRKPIAVLDETGGWQQPAFMKRSPLVHVFTMTTSRRAGWKVGRYLLERGHRAVAFIAPYHKASWSVNRLEGLSSAFSDAGVASPLRVRTLNQFTSRHDYLELGRSRSAVAELQRFYSRWRGGLPPAFAGRVDQAMEHLSEVACADGEIACQLESLFDDLIGDPAISAWVAVNDYTARMAAEYLQRRSIPVPGRISLVSFDDTPEAVEYGITSYNFNFVAVVNAMLSYLVRFKPDAPGRPGKSTEIEGHIVERRSCGRATAGGDRG